MKKRPTTERPTPQLALLSTDEAGTTADHAISVITNAEETTRRAQRGLLDAQTVAGDTVLTMLRSSGAGQMLASRVMMRFLTAHNARLTKQVLTAIKQESLQTDIDTFMRRLDHGSVTRSRRDILADERGVTDHGMPGFMEPSPIAGFRPGDHVRLISNPDTHGPIVAMVQKEDAFNIQCELPDGRISASFPRAAWELVPDTFQSGDYIRCPGFYGPGADLFGTVSALSDDGLMLMVRTGSSGRMEEVASSRCRRPQTEA